MYYKTPQEIKEEFREIIDRLKKIEIEVEENPGVIPVEHLLDAHIIEKKIKKLEETFSDLDEAIFFFEQLGEIDEIKEKYEKLKKAFKILKKKALRKIFGGK